MFKTNQKKFLAIKKLELPIGQYAITGSGPMGIRKLREIGDIDIIVNSELWGILSEKYGVVEENGVIKIVFSEDNIEALGKNSFCKLQKDPNLPSVADRIQQAEIIEGLPFESLDHVVYFKRKMGRDKDLKDIQTIEAYRSQATTNNKD